MSKKKSIVVDYDNFCAICGKPRDCDHHLVFGNGLRKLADEDGLFIPIDNGCHNMQYTAFRTGQIHDNSMAESLSKMLGECAWERYKIAEELADLRNRLNEFTKENGRTTPEAIISKSQTEFMARYGRSFL